MPSYGVVRFSADLCILPLFSGESIERKDQFIPTGVGVVEVGKSADTADACELYDMTTDRTETRNLIEVQTEVANALQLNELNAWVFNNRITYENAKQKIFF